MSDPDPLEQVFTPVVLDALDDRIARRVDEVLAELLTITDENDEPTLEAAVA